MQAPHALLATLPQTQAPTGWAVGTVAVAAYTARRVSKPEPEVEAVYALVTAGTHRYQMEWALPVPGLTSPTSWVASTVEPVWDTPVTAATALPAQGRRQTRATRTQRVCCSVKT